MKFAPLFALAGYAAATANTTVNLDDAFADLEKELNAATEHLIIDKAGCTDAKKGQWVEQSGVGVCVTYAGKAYNKDMTVQEDASKCPGGCAVAGMCAEADEASKKVCDEYNPDGGSGVGLIIAIIVGLLVAVGVGILLWCCCCKGEDDDFKSG